jgi:hypothetical protein
MSATANMVKNDTPKPALFQCDKCGFELPVKAGLFGMRVKCPKCTHVGKVILRSKSTHSEQAEAPRPEARRCPFCLEVLPGANEDVPADSQEDAGSEGAGIPVAAAKEAVPRAAAIPPLGAPRLGQNAHEPTNGKGKSPAATNGPSSQRAAETPIGATAFPAAQVPAKPTTGEGKTSVGSNGSSPQRAADAPAKPPNGNGMTPAGMFGTPTQREGATPPKLLYAAAKDESTPTTAARNAVLEPRTRCPYCHEDIFVHARKCKHCGEFLDEELRMTRLKTVAGVATTGFLANGTGKRAKIAALCAAAVVVVGLSIVTIRALVGSGGGTSSVQARGPEGSGAAQAGGGGEAAGASAHSSSSIEPLAKSLRPVLVAAEFKDLAGSALKFTASGAGAEPWNAQVRPAIVPGKGALGVITLPYQFISTDPKAPSTRGKFVLELTMRGQQWVLDRAFREARFRGAPGHESEIPEEDRQRAIDNDSTNRLRDMVERIQAGTYESGAPPGGTAAAPAASPVAVAVAPPTSPAPAVAAPTAGPVPSAAPIAAPPPAVTPVATPAPTPVAAVPAPPAAPAIAAPAAPAGAGAQSGIEPLAKALRQTLETTEMKDAAGVVQFASSGTGAEPWKSQVRPSLTPGKGQQGIITLPYQFTSAEPKVPSSRGKLILEFSMSGQQWVLDRAFREVRFRGGAGHESEIPEEDRSRAPDNDTVARIQEVLQKIQPGS